MRTTVLVLAGILAAGPAFAQAQRDSSAYPSDESLPPSAVLEGSQGVGEQQAALPEEEATNKHPGRITKLRGAFMDSPVVEGDAYPENFLGLPEPKESKK